jgi:micrococcal nuclease
MFQMLARVFVFIAAICFAVSVTAAELTSWTGKVVGITDGDTIRVMPDAKPVKIRLSEIDTPEKGQPFGNKARQITGQLAHGKTVQVRPKTVDHYGRIVADIILPSGHSLTQALVALGMAWHYVRYSNDNRLATIEANARKQHKGLWSDSEPVPPWDWRKGKRTASDSR